MHLLARLDCMRQRYRLFKRYLRDAPILDLRHRLAVHDEGHPRHRVGAKTVCFGTCMQMPSFAEVAPRESTILLGCLRQGLRPKDSSDLLHDTWLFLRRYTGIEDVGKTTSTIEMRSVGL